MSGPTYLEQAAEDQYLAPREPDEPCATCGDTGRVDDHACWSCGEGERIALLLAGGAR